MIESARIQQVSAFQHLQKYDYNRSTISTPKQSKKSRIHEACRDARNFLETSCGFEFISEADKSAMHDPITRLPTTVQIISSYGQNKAIIGGHPNGVKFILQNKKHFGITNGYLMNSPALNTFQYSHIEQRLNTFLQNIGNDSKASDCKRRKPQIVYGKFPGMS